MPGMQVVKRAPNHGNVIPRPFAPACPCQFVCIHEDHMRGVNQVIWYPRFSICAYPGRY